MNIVYGGSFNPPTIAHEAIICELKKIYRPENLIILPTGNSYNRKDLIDFKYRYEMLKLISNDIISDYENNNKNYKGTLNALNYFSNNYNDLYFVMGADNLIQIKTWIRYEELLDKYHFIIITRDDIDVLKFINDEIPGYKNRFSFIKLKYDVSSSNIRKNIEDNKDMLNLKVYEYIKKNHLYEV